MIDVLKIALLTGVLVCSLPCFRHCDRAAHCCHACECKCKACDKGGCCRGD